MHSITSTQRAVVKTTIYDIARRVGTSHATVSRALRDNPAISRATRERVKRVADEMHYRPNLLARGLIRGATKTVGLLINGYFIEVALAKVLTLDQLADGEGYQLFVTNTEGDFAKTLHAA